MATTGQITGNAKRDGFFLYGYVLMVIGALVALSALTFHFEPLFYVGAAIAVVGLGMRLSSLVIKR